MKRNLSSQAIRAMAIGMAVTMGATTALSGVVGNVAVVKAAGFESITNASTTLAQNNYVVTETGLVFKITSVSGTTGNASFVGKQDISALDGEQNGTAIETPFKSDSLSGTTLTVTTDQQYTITIDKIGANEGSIKTLSSADFTGLTALEIEAGAFNGVTVTDALDLSSTTIAATAFNNGIFSNNLTLSGTASIAAETFKGVTINGDLNLSSVTTVNDGAFKGTSNLDKGITVGGTLTLNSSGVTLGANSLDYVNIGTLDLTGQTTTATTFTGSKFGTLTLPADYAGVANAFESATIETLAFQSGFTGTVNKNAFVGSSTGPVIKNLDLTNVTDGKLDNKFGTGAVATAATITNITHNGVTKIGGAKVKGNVTFTGASIGADVFKDTKFEAGSKITIDNANKVQSSSTNAFQFAADSKTNIEFGAYADATDKANIVAAFGTGLTSGKVNILLPKGKDTEVASLNTALTTGSVQNVKTYVNNVVAGIDNPASAITLNQNDYILTSNGELFKVVRAKGDIPVAEAAFVGTVAEAGASGEANGTTIPYVATLTEDTLSIAPSSGEAVTCKVNQIGDGATALSKYTINGSISASEGVLTEYTLNVPTGKSVEIANKAFENITNVTITSTEGITAIGNEAFKGATISTGKLNTVNVETFGDNAFKGATLTEEQEIVVNETAVASLGTSTFAFKTPVGDTLIRVAAPIKIKLQAYTAANKETVKNAFSGATGLTNVTVEIPYSLEAEALKSRLQEALTSASAGVSVTVGEPANQGTAAPKVGDKITTQNGDVFEVVKTEVTEGEATPGEVKLVTLGNGSQGRAVSTFINGTFENGVLKVTYNTSKTATFNVTELGDGSKAITTGTVAVDTLIPYLTNSTTLASKALEGTTIVAGPKVSITIPETLTTLGATSLQLSNQSAIVIKVPGYGTEEATKITKKELVAAIGTTQAQITIELPAGADSASLKAALTSAPRVEVRTELPADAIGTTVKATKKGVGTYTFKIIEQENTADVEKTTKNKVALVEFTPVEAPSTREAEANFSGAGVQINGVDYALSQLGDGENPIKGVTDAALDAITTTNVTTVAANAFKDNKDVTKIDLTIAGTIEANAFAGSGVTSVNLPLATEIGESAFAGADKLQTVDLPKVTTVGDSAFSKTSVTTVSLPSATTIGASAFQNTKVEKVDLPKAETIGSSAFESTSVQSINAPKATTVGANAFANNEKLVSVNVGTEATGQIKIDSSALSGSSNITVVNTNKDSKDQVTEAIKQSGTQNNVTVSAGGTTETVKPEEETKKPSNGGVSGGGANIGSSNGSSNTTTETVTETTTETTTEGTTQTPDKTLSLDVISLPSVEGEAVSFSDVSDSSWAKSYIDKLSTAGIISGSNGKFNPNGQTKRADVTVMLVKLLGLTPETNNKFTDVDPNAYYAPYVGAASSYGIVNGSNGMFKPESVISRQDTMVMIAQILRGLNLNVNTDTSTLNQFSDVNNISSYAQESVAVLVNSGIISGSNGKLNPTKPVTRAEMATIMSKLYDLIDSAN